jgi:DNA-binding NarL/FixJ family response regulator
MGTVLVALAQPLIRIGVRVTVDEAPDFEVVGEIDDVGGVEPAVASLKPDILLLDSWFQQRAEHLVPGIVQDYPSVRVLIMVDHTDQSCTLRSLLSGPREHRPTDEALKVMKECCLLALRESAQGCLPKASTPEVLLTSLRSAMAGEMWVGPGLTQHWRDWWARGADESSLDKTQLTGRELEVVGLVVDGLSNAEIGENLGLKEQTVKNHLARIMAKLGARNRVELALRAVREHLA